MLKVPPHSIEAEQSVLGSILIDKDSLISISDLIKADDFYSEQNGLIFEVIIELFKLNKPIDIITVKEKLDDKNLLDRIGGISYLTELTEIVPTTANVYEYAQIVKNKAVLRNLIRSGNEIIGFGYDEDKDINELLEKSEKSIFEVTQVFIKNKLTHINDILDNRYKEFCEIAENPDLIKKHRLQVGYKDIDDKLNGLKGGDMMVLAARPSMGKTAFALNIAQNVGFKGKNVAIFSLEMSKEQLTDRLIASAIEIDSWKLAKGALTNDEFAKIGEALEKLGQANIYIDDTAGGSIIEIKSKARRLKIESGLDLIIIDYMQLMSSGNTMNRVQEMSDISRNIKSLARELEVPIIAISQLSRTVEQRLDKRPIMSDLRESGGIEQDADIIMMLYRDDYYNPEDSDSKGITEVLIRKNRNGPIGNIELIFEKSKQKFVAVDWSKRDHVTNED